MKRNEFSKTRWRGYMLLYRFWTGIARTLEAIYDPLHILALNRIDRWEAALSRENVLPPSLYPDVASNDADESMEELIQHLEYDSYYRYRQ